MTYPTTTEKIWLANIADDRCTIGSGDYEIARDIPLDIGRLIAAAPALLAALIEYVERHEQSCEPTGLPEYEEARAAIARATGE